MPNETPETRDLAPCPSCGGPARLYVQEVATFVTCDSVEGGCGQMQTWHYLTDDDGDGHAKPNAIAAWNRRALPAPPASAPAAEGRVDVAAAIEKLIGPDGEARWLYKSCRDGFIRCERCGEQTDTGDCDFVKSTGEAFAAYDAALAPPPPAERAGPGLGELLHRPEIGMDGRCYYMYAPGRICGHALDRHYEPEPPAAPERAQPAAQAGEMMLPGDPAWEHEEALEAALMDANLPTIFSYRRAADAGFKLAQADNTLTEAVDWVLNDARYKAPEQITPECRRWIDKLSSARLTDGAAAEDGSE
jgi:hypothetical protein